MFPEREFSTGETGRSRRRLLWEAGGGLAGIALAQMFAQEQGRAATHHPPKAKNVILIFLPGGVSHVDTFDYKPALAANHGKETKCANTITPFFGITGKEFS